MSEVANQFDVIKIGRSGSHSTKLVLHSSKIEWKSNLFSYKLGRLSSISMGKVVRVMKGKHTANFSKFGNIEGFALSVIYKDNEGKETSLDIVTKSVEAQETIEAMIIRSMTKHSDCLIAHHRSRLDIIWDKYDKDGSNSLSLEEIIELMSGMNIHISRKKVIEQFKKYDSDNNNSLNKDEFSYLLRDLRARQDISALYQSMNSKIKFDNLSVLGNQVNLFESSRPIQDFELFWRTYQMLDSESPDADMNTLRATLAELMKCGGDDITDGGALADIDYNTFLDIMSSRLNDIFDPSRLRISDLSQPLSHYFIASSHNTYLEGDQLTSKSSVNRYVNDLLDNCRCIELDCWDGDDLKPIITHGHTLTGSILFEDVVKAIKTYGFQTSTLPIIFSIENHCSVEQQKILASLLRSTFGDDILLPRSDHSLPSPAEGRGKIIVKGKRLKVESKEQDDFCDDDDDDEAPQTKPVKHVKIAQELSNLTLLGTGKVKTFDEITLKIDSDMMCSYGESKTFKNLSDDAVIQNWIRHNQSHMSRIYPKGTRIDSSNYDPSQCWEAGNQIVALNYQTKDLPFFVNFGRFRASEGYLLKPDHLLTCNQVSAKPQTLTIRVISAQQLPKSNGAARGEIVDPYVIVNINGGVNGEVCSRRTKTVNNNGFNPFWNEEFKFIIKNITTSILTFQVLDEDAGGMQNNFIAFSSLPVTCARRGLRSVQLFDAYGKDNNEYAHASLFVFVDLE